MGGYFRIGRIWMIWKNLKGHSRIWEGMDEIGVEMGDHGRIWDEIKGHGKLLEDVEEYRKI